MDKQEAIDALQNATGSKQRLKRQDFDLMGDVAGKRTQIASFEAESVVVFRESSIRLMFVVHESFTTDGSGNAQTFGLSNNIIDTANTAPFVLYSDDASASADSVDYDADEFTYTDGGAAEDLDVFYVARDPVQVEIEKSAPRAQGNVEEVMFDDVTSMLHERDQNRDPPMMEFDRELEPVVPRNWTVEIYSEGDTELAWEDDGGNVEAINAVVSIPITRGNSSIEGLGHAVKQDIID